MLQELRSFRTHLIAVLALVLLAGLALGGCSRPESVSNQQDKPAEETRTATPTVAPDPGDTDAGQAARLYFVRGETLGVAGRALQAPDADAQALLEQAVRALLNGPTQEEKEFGLATGIPDGTELLGLTLGDGSAVVDLSDRFDDGGGSLSMQMRAAQIVYTVTQPFSTGTTPLEVERVSFRIEGEPVDALGGEGLEVTNVTRTDFTNVLPMILVESPTPGQKVTSPISLTGLANVFEGQFLVNVTDPEGLIVTEQVVTGGTMGEWSPFTAMVEFETEREGLGAVIVFESSPKDGSQVNVVEIPVRMEP